MSTFGQGSDKEPPYLVDELTGGLGEARQSDNIWVKSHAFMAGTHCTIDTVAELQNEYPDKLSNLEGISSIKIEMSEAAFNHGGWKAQQPLSALAAQMSCAYVAAVQLIDRRVSPQEFHQELLDRDDLWDLVNKTECYHTPELGEKYEQRVTIAFKDGSTVAKTLAAPQDITPELLNEEISEKFRQFTEGIVDDQRRDAIERGVGH